MTSERAAIGDDGRAVDGAGHGPAEGAGRRRFLAAGGAIAAATGAAMLTSLPAGAQEGFFVPVYLPIGPVRIYDSRQGEGRISQGTTRTLVGEPAGEVWAECYNLTVADTGAPGWLSVFPAGETWPGTSSINWYQSGMTIANNAYTEIRQSDSGIDVRCGGAGASTHFLLDLMGALVFIDLAAGAAPSGRAGRAALTEMVVERARARRSLTES